MPQEHRDKNRDRVASSDAARTPKARAKWVLPAITDHGSLRHLVRGATGPHGDPGTPIGKRA